MESSSSCFMYMFYHQSNVGVKAQIGIRDYIGVNPYDFKNVVGT